MDRTANESGTSSEFDEEDTTQRGLEGYQFEPKRQRLNVGDTSNSESDTSESGGSETDHVDRLADTTWCRCGKCSLEWLKRTKECVCCGENPTSKALASPSNTDDTVCIANNGDFILLCLNPLVLQNVLVGLNNIRGDHWEVMQPNNRSLRYAAYRQYTWWVYKKLGKRRRRVIPACVTHTIKQQFPKGDDEEYEGYHSADENSS